MKISRSRHLGAVALSLSVVAGGFLMANAAPRKPSNNKPAQPAPKGGPLDKVLASLKLTTEQKAAIKVIVDAANAQIKALNDDTTLTRDEKLTAHKAICDEAFAKISALLTTEQKTTFDAWVAAQGAKGEKLKGDGDCKDKPKGDKPKTTPTTKPTTTPTTAPTVAPTPGTSYNRA